MVHKLQTNCVKYINVTITAHIHNPEMGIFSNLMHCENDQHGCVKM